MTRPLVLLAIIGFLALPGSATATGSATLVVSEVYGGGGNAGAPYTNDFVELRNLSAAPVSLSGWSIQYASATGSVWSVTPLPALNLAPGQFLLVQEASGGPNGSPLPTPDATGTIAMAAAAGKVALVASTSALSGTCPTGLVDLVGYGGTANCFEGTAAAPAPSNTLSDQRAAHGLADSDDNAADFSTAAPDPQNMSSPTAVSLRFFSARREGRTVMLRWRTGSEAGLLGFEVFRGTTRINRLPIRALGGPSGRTYSFPDPRPGNAVRYRLRALQTDGSRVWLAATRLSPT
jgi:predicted extracellular nuclease